MALKVHLPDGNFICPKCGATVGETEEKCPKCGVSFEGVKQGKKCPKCGTINDADAAICMACGYSFAETKKPGKSSKNDEEFLQKLLTWGKSLAEQEAEDYQEEAERVVDVFKKVTGINIEDIGDGEGGEEWEKKIRRIERFVSSLVDMLKEEKEGMEKKLKAARKEATKNELKEEIDIIEKEIKGLERASEDLADIYRYIKDALKSKKDESIEKERQLRKEIANIKKGSMKREEDLREHINSLTAEIEELRKRIGKESSAVTLVEDWLKLEKKMEKEIAALEKKEKDEEIGDFVYEMKKETNTVLSAIRIRVEEENELRRMLKVLDDLLEKLPEEIIEEFAKSEDFRLYERIMDRYHVGE